MVKLRWKKVHQKLPYMGPKRPAGGGGDASSASSNGPEFKRLKSAAYHNKIISRSQASTNDDIGHTASKLIRKISSSEGSNIVNTASRTKHVLVILPFELELFKNATTTKSLSSSQASDDDNATSTPPALEEVDNGEVTVGGEGDKAKPRRNSASSANPAAELGRLENLDTETPVMYISFPESNSQLKLKGCLLRPQQTYVGLKIPGKIGGDVRLAGVYETVIVFSEWEWIGENSIENVAVQESDVAEQSSQKRNRRRSSDSVALIDASSDDVEVLSLEEEMNASDSDMNDSQPNLSQSRRASRRMSASKSINYAEDREEGEQSSASSLEDHPKPHSQQSSQSLPKRNSRVAVVMDSDVEMQGADTPDENRFEIDFDSDSAGDSRRNSLDLSSKSNKSNAKQRANNKKQARGSVRRKREHSSSEEEVSDDMPILEPLQKRSRRSSSKQIKYFEGDNDDQNSDSSDQETLTTNKSKPLKSSVSKRTSKGRPNQDDMEDFVVISDSE
jgi:hypothetical protein